MFIKISFKNNTKDAGILNVRFTSSVGRAEKKIAFVRGQRGNEVVWESTESSHSECSEMSVSLEQCRVLLIYRIWETLLARGGIINLVKNLHRVINYCHNLKAQRYKMEY